MTSEKFLEKLIDAPTPSGYEEIGLELFKEYCSEFAEHYYEDKIGNVVYSIGHGKTKILLSAHIDELGFQVMGVKKNGLLTISSLGGVDKKVLPGSKVMVECGDNWVIGVIGKKPIHAESHKDRETVNDIEELTIDLGFSSDTEVKERGIDVGSLAVYDRCISDLKFGKDLIMGPGLDDKAGIFLVAEIGRRLSHDFKDSDEYQILLGATVQEEVGLRGATVMAQNIKPDISIDFDVTPTTDFGVKAEEWGDVTLGEGAVIEIGPDKSRRLVNIIKSVAKEANELYQLVPTGRPGGTNTTVLQLFGGDCETAHIALPIRNLHTPVEICSMKDINAVKEIVVKLVENKQL